MPLTSGQKHFIKKNIERRSVEEIADSLNLSSREVIKFARKILPPKKFAKIIQNKPLKFSSGPAGSFSAEGDINVAEFSFSKFFLDNLPYFIVLFVAILLVYFNALNNDFVSDDRAAILNNPNIANFSKYVAPALIGPVRALLLYLIYKIAGPVAIYFRMLNIFFHLGSTFIIFTLISILYNKRSIAFVSALIFAVHPILIESVAWISGGPYCQLSFFMLLGLIWYVLSKNKPNYYYLSIVSFLAAISSGAPGVMLPVIIFLYEISFGQIKNGWKRVLPYFIILAVVVIVNLGLVGQRINSLNNQFYENANGLQNPFAQIPVSITSYLHLIFWPDKLTLYHTELQYTQGQFAFVVFIFLIFLGLVIWGWFKNKSIFFWLSFFVVTLGPSLTPLKIAWVVAERYVYLGTLGVIVVAVLFWYWLMEKSGEKYKPLFYGIIAIIVIALSIRTIIRNVDWKNEDNLWVATDKVAPSGAPIHNNMGDVYARHGDYQKAIDEFTKATEINPGYADAFHNIANVYQMMGDADHAIAYYDKALSLNPNIWQSWQNLSAIYYQKGDYQQAYDDVEKAVALQPQNADLQNNLQAIKAKMPQQ